MPVRFGLQDIKKQVHRRGGTLSVSLHFLRPGELGAEIEHLVTYHEQLLGQPKRDFSIEDARACIGDYRLAHCLIGTLSAWYSWRQRDWQEALQRLGNDTLARFEQKGGTSPVHLRLALFNYVNEHYSGFLDAQVRTEALEKFAELYCGKDAQQGVQAPCVSDLEYLLALDSEEEALLMRDAPHPPSAGQVAALYNQWVFEAALFNASDVHFKIDCNAFVTMQDVDTGMPTTGIGAVIKRLCYLARKMGVYYDLAYDSDSVTTNTSSAILHLTLYGPQEMTGAPQQYGLRLARLSRILLGYSGQGARMQANHGGRPYNTPTTNANRSIVGAGLAPALSTPSAPSTPSARSKLPTTALLEAEATVHFLQRTYRFAMDSNLLKLLPPPSETNLIETHVSATASTNPVGARFIPPSFSPAQSVDEHTPSLQEHHTLSLTRNASPPSSTLFDSSIEQTFAEAFQALANSDGADGWRLEREPEPLLLTHSSAENIPGATLQGIFIPDFALTRGKLRIYVEILGFWTPAYRERKIAKLQQLKDRHDLVLAIPVEASDAFASLATDFPIVYYDGQLSATELLKVLRTHYDDLAGRLSRIDVHSVCKRVESEGLLPERTCYALLHCYRRSELLRAAELVVGEGIAFTPGVGLYQIDWLEQLRTSFVEWLREVGGKSPPDFLSEEGGSTGEEQNPLPLPWVLTESRTLWPALAACEDVTLEALISLWPEVHINRNSIFEATLEVVDVDKEGTSFAEKRISLPGVEGTPKKSMRARRTNTKKRIVRETSQADLWG